METIITAVGPDNCGLADPIVHDVTGRGANIAEIQMYDHDEEALFSMLLRVDVPEHFHKVSDELIQVLRGEGTMTIDGIDRPAKPEDFFFVPKGKVHAFRLKTETAAALSIFTPAFRAGDRHYRVPVSGSRKR